MAHESFEAPAIAKLMNEHFINVKVDREERPDVDPLYQGVIQLMGRGAAGRSLPQPHEPRVPVARVATGR